MPEPRSADGRTAVAPRRAALLTLGCARNEVDSEELAGRLTGGGWELVDADDAAGADVIVVNTCGFVEQAKKDSIDTLLAASDAAAEPARRSSPSAAWPSATARSWPTACPRPTRCSASTPTPSSAERLADVLGGHAPGRARARSTGARCCRSPRWSGPPRPPTSHVPGHAWVPDLARTRLSTARSPPLKLASGCDRRCAFCAIPSFRGSFVSRPPDDVVAEAAWLGVQGVRELVLVSENSTSYGKDLPGGTRALVRLLPRLAHVPGIDRVRVSYLQPAEMRPDLLEVIATTPGRRALLRPVVPARQPRRAAPDAPLRLAGRTSSTCARGSARSRPRPASAAT